LRCGLQVRGIAVPPAAVETPDVADDELGLVVDGAEVRSFKQVRRGAYRVEDVIEARARVHERDGLVVQRLEELRGLGERAVDAVASPYRPAVARAEEIGVERVHRPQRTRPVVRVALHLLRVTAVRRGPDEEIAGAEDAALRD